MAGGSNQPIVSMKSLHGVDHLKARGPLALSEEVTRPRLKKAGHVIVHFDPKVKLQFDCNFVSTFRDVYFYVGLRRLIL